MRAILVGQVVARLDTLDISAITNVKNFHDLPRFFEHFRITEQSAQILLHYMWQQC